MTNYKSKKSSVGKSITAEVGKVAAKKPQAKAATVRNDKSGPLKKPGPSFNDENEKPFTAVGSSNLAAARALLQIGESKSSTVMQNLTNVLKIDGKNNDDSDDESDDESDGESDVDQMKGKPKKSQVVLGSNPGKTNLGHVMEPFMGSPHSDEESDIENDSPLTLASIMVPVSEDICYLGPIRSIEMVRIGTMARAELGKSNCWRGVLNKKRNKKKYSVTIGIGKECKRIDVKDNVDLLLRIIYYLILLHWSTQNIMETVNLR